MTAHWTSPDGLITLHLGDWRETLQDVKPDSVITDPPYSARVHDGQRSSTSAGVKNAVDYNCLTDELLRETVIHWAPLEPQWVVIWSDHVTQRLWESELQGAGLYTFSPVGWVKSDAAPRFAGDGPATSVEFMTVARPRKQILNKGSRPGHYNVRSGGRRGLVGAKDINGVRAVVRDYSQPGDLIVDPYAGTGTTLLAAAIEGRRAIGSELDPGKWAAAVHELKRGWTPDLFAEAG